MPFPQHVRIVLVEPESPGNIGAAARAMKTMGLEELWLVKPACDPRSDEAYWMAHNSTDVLKNARIAARLEDALADTVVSFATTQRTRRQHAPFYSPEEAAKLAAERSAADRPAAFVFGRESSGLTNHEVTLCSVQSTIPAATSVPAINLAQAVMIYACALYQAATPPGFHAYPWKLARHAELEQFYTHLEVVLAHLGAKPASTMENYVARFRRVISRIPLESRDVRVLHNLLTRASVGSGPAPSRDKGYDVS